VIVKLSRRNILTLLHKLEMDGSACSIIKPDDTVVMVEPDEIHYEGRENGPGVMHPETEQFVADMEAALEIVRRGGCCGGCCEPH
jgi:hypothetical protein